MSKFCAYCNDVFETKGNDGIERFDYGIRKEIKEEIIDENVVEMEKMVDIGEALLENRDDKMREHIRARVILVIARMFESMNPDKREHTKRYVDEDIPCSWEAEKRYDELNQ